MIWGVQGVIAYFYDSSKQVGVVFNFDWCVSLRITMSFFFVFKLGIDWIRSYRMVRSSKIVIGSFLLLS